MQALRNIKTFAKKLVDLSFEGGFVSEERVSGILEVLRNKPPRYPRRILKLYLIRLQHAIKASEALVEYCGEIDQNALSSLSQDLEKHYQRKLKLVTKENTDLLAGLRIYVGDDVWDASVQGRIERLAESF